MSRVWKILTVILLIIIAVLPLSSGGTGDVSIWQGWIEAIERDGFITGYIPVYPPITWFFLQGVVYTYHAFNIDMFLAIKWWLVLFLLLNSAVFLLWTRNLKLTALLHLSLVLSSVALGYLDIWLAPTLLLAFWALKERKIFLFTVLFTVSFLVKWQPLILAPFLLAYIVRLTGVKDWKTTIKVLLRDVALPAGVLIGIMVLLFGQGLLLSLEDGLHTGLTGNALNYNWLVTAFLQSTQPERFGALADGVVNYIGITEWLPTDWPIVLIPRILFALFYLSALIVFLRRSNSFENLLRFTIVGYLAYFTWNIGVHENHLFLAGLLVVVLYWLNTRDLYPTLLIVLITNINLFLFYGINGGYPYQRVIAGLDISVPLALFNVVFFLAFWATTCWHKEPDSKVSVPEQPKFDHTDTILAD